MMKLSECIDELKKIIDSPETRITNGNPASLNDGSITYYVNVETPYECFEDIRKAINRQTKITPAFKIDYPIVFDADNLDMPIYFKMCIFVYAP